MKILTVLGSVRTLIFDVVLDTICIEFCIIRYSFTLNVSSFNMQLAGINQRIQIGLFEKKN